MQGDITEVAALSQDTEIIVRPAVPADAVEAVDLIYLPMGKLADYLFGSDDKQCALKVLRELFVQPNNRFSYTFCDVLDANGRVVGLLLAYPSDTLKDLEAPMAGQLSSIVGLAGMFRLFTRGLPLQNLKEADPGEYFILTFAIAPDFQQKGLGGRLLAHAEEKARAAGLLNCSLGVDLDNERARHFYERHGYRIVETIHVPQLEKALGYPGYYRMAKTLARRTAVVGSVPQ